MLNSGRLDALNDPFRYSLYPHRDYSGLTILEVHLYAPDLGEIIPNSEKCASDLGQVSTPGHKRASNSRQIIPTSENLPSDSGQVFANPKRSM